MDPSPWGPGVPVGSKALRARWPPGRSPGGQQRPPGAQAPAQGPLGALVAPGGPWALMGAQGTHQPLDPPEGPRATRAPDGPQSGWANVPPEGLGLQPGAVGGGPGGPPPWRLPGGAGVAGGQEGLRAPVAPRAPAGSPRAPGGAPEPLGALGPGPQGPGSLWGPRGRQGFLRGLRGLSWSPRNPPGAPGLPSGPEEAQGPRRRRRVPGGPPEALR